MRLEPKGIEIVPWDSPTSWTGHQDHFDESSVTIRSSGVTDTAFQVLAKPGPLKTPEIRNTRHWYGIRMMGALEKRVSDVKCHQILILSRKDWRPWFERYFYGFEMP